jgi:hypothetical protein
MYSVSSRLFALFLFFAVLLHRVDSDARIIPLTLLFSTGCVVSVTRPLVWVVARRLLCGLSRIRCAIFSPSFLNIVLLAYSIMRMAVPACFGRAHGLRRQKRSNSMRFLPTTYNFFRVDVLGLETWRN